MALIRFAVGLVVAWMLIASAAVAAPAEQIDDRTITVIAAVPAGDPRAMQSGCYPGCTPAACAVACVGACVAVLDSADALMATQRPTPGVRTAATPHSVDDQPNPPPPR